MHARERRARSHRRARQRSMLWAEGLEARRLLIATPIGVASGLTLAIDAPSLQAEEAPAPAPIAESIPGEAGEPMALDAWDAALGLVGADAESSEDGPDSPADRVEGLAVAGAVVLAWGGWKARARAEIRSRRRLLPAGPRVA
ncbi:hypothetical protein TA3x_000088 [Tundrisphaera sp. TA3]|uniref:hypothetical protein n=1 Tax=Tundrisphaera sp. TA3 TaxID=3435775 RepID=UPI003EC09D17